MILHERTVPFSIDGNFAETDGILRLDQNGLHLEFQGRDEVIGLFKTGVKTIHLDLRKVKSLEFKKGWFTRKLILRTTDMQSIGSLPGAKSGMVKLGIARADAADAADLASAVGLELSELRLKKWEAEVQSTD